MKKDWIKENIGEIIQVLIIVVIIVGAFWYLEKNDYRDWGWILFGAFLLIFYFIDDPHKFIHRK